MGGVSICEARKSFGTQTVLDGLSIDIRAGEFVVLLGPSGCGKSTVLNAIAGLETLDSGTVRIGQEVVTDWEPSRRGVAMVFQSYALYPTMTVAGNLGFGLRMAGTPAAAIRARVAAVAQMLQIRDLLERKPAQLSGGQRQRVAIGRAIIRNAALYLFDEPLSNLDARLRVDMRLEIKRLHQQLAATMVYVTHDQIEAMTLATRVAVMHRGRIEQYAEPQVLYDRPATIFVAGFVGSPAMNLLPGILRCNGSRIWAELSGAHLPLDQYSFQNPPADGHQIIVGLRPEDIGLSGSGSDPVTCIELPVLARELLGATSMIWCAFGRERLAASLGPGAATGIGERVRLQLRPGRVSVFCANSQQRL
jgi:multiple sugar transport system ATP-binding protein